MSIVIIDYGMGNSASIRNMLKKIGTPARITRDLGEIAEAEKLILPGVGAFDAGMRHLEEYGLLEPLERRVQRDGVPILGICLGMQLFTRGSEEGTLPGLGWVDADTKRFEFPAGREQVAVPHMGWNSIEKATDSPLYTGLDGELRFYFVHSYHVVPDRETDVLARTTYSMRFVSGVETANIIGVQFHPEKSHRFGMALLKNFVDAY